MIFASEKFCKIMVDAFYTINVYMIVEVPDI